MAIGKLNFNTGAIVDPYSGLMDAMGAKGAMAQALTAQDSAKEQARAEQLAKDKMSAEEKYRQDTMAQRDRLAEANTAQRDRLAQLPYQKAAEESKLSGQAIQDIGKTSEFGSAVGERYAALPKDGYDKSLEALNKQILTAYEKDPQGFDTVSEQEAKTKQAELQQRLAESGVSLPAQKTVLDQYKVGLDIATGPSKEALESIREDKKMRLDVLNKQRKALLDGATVGKSGSKDNSVKAKYGETGDVLTYVSPEKYGSWDSDDAKDFVEKATSGQLLSGVAVPPKLVQEAIQRGEYSNWITDNKVDIDKATKYLQEQLGVGGTNAKNPTAQKLTEQYNLYRNTGSDGSGTRLDPTTAAKIQEISKAENAILQQSLPALNKTGRDLADEIFSRRAVTQSTPTAPKKTVKKEEITPPTIGSDSADTLVPEEKTKRITTPRTALPPASAPKGRPIMNAVGNVIGYEEAEDIKGENLQLYRSIKRENPEFSEERALERLKTILSQ